MGGKHHPNQINKDRHCNKPPWKAVKMPASPVRQAICQPSAMILQTATDSSLVAGDTGFLLFFFGRHFTITYRWIKLHLSDYFVCSSDFFGLRGWS
jgi:hypothetical protein